MRARPGFAEALFQDARAGLEFHDLEIPFNRAVSDMASFILGLLALSLHYSGGLSHRRLRHLGGHGGLVSAGRATAILWRLQRDNFVITEARRTGLVRLYTPMPAMVEAFRERMRRLCAAAGIIDESCRRVSLSLSQDTVFESLLAALGARIVQAAEDPNPLLAPLNSLSMRQGAMLLIYSLIAAAHAEGAPGPSGPARFSAAAAARRFGGSRSHIGRLIGEMEREGFVQRTADPNLLTLTERFAEVYEFYFAIGVAGLAAACTAALQARGVSEMGAVRSS